MAIPASKFIIDGTAYPTVGKLIEKLMSNGMTPDEVYEYCGGKTASLASAVSVAKKNLGISTPKAPKAEKVSPLLKIASAEDDSSARMFCPHCGTSSKFRTIAVSNGVDGAVSKTISIACTSCKVSTQVKV